MITFRTKSEKMKRASASAESEEEMERERETEKEREKYWVKVSWYCCVVDWAGGIKHYASVCIVWYKRSDSWCSLLLILHLGSIVCILYIFCIWYQTLDVR